MSIDGLEAQVIEFAKRARASSDAAVVWIENADRLQALNSCFSTYLTQQELERRDRYRRAEDAARFSAGRFLMKSVAAAFFECTIAECDVFKDEDGRPLIHAPAAATPPMFDINMTHTDGVVAIAASYNGARIGVDCESPPAPKQMLRIAEAHYAPSERQWLRGQPPSQQEKSFLILWTLKEALVKATGRGLRASLRTPAFILERGRIGIKGASASSDWRRWRFCLGETENARTLAVAHAGKRLLFAGWRLDGEYKARRADLAVTATSADLRIRSDVRCVGENRSR